MSTREEKFAYLHTEIENDRDISEDAVLREADTARGETIPDAPADADGAAPEASPFSLEIDSMMESRDRNNWIYQINYDKEPEPSHSVRQAVKNWFRQKVRRLIAPVVAPLVLDQNTFNASVTTSVNLLSDNERTVAQFIRAQEEENAALRRQVRELTREVEQLRAETHSAHLETIRVRKHLHREIELLLEEVENGENLSKLYQ